MGQAFRIDTLFSLCFLGGLALLALFGPLFFDFDPDQVAFASRLLGPSSEHLLGCDIYGRDLLGAMIFGAKCTLYVAFTSVAVSVAFGTLMGLIAGYMRGKVEWTIMAVVEILLAFPGILLTMALAALLGPSINNLIIAISLTGWTATARLVRGQVLSLREREFVLANQALGARSLRTILVHILPSTLPFVIIAATFSLSGVIIVEASLSFLGLGGPVNLPTWGSLLNQGRTVLLEAPHLSIAPGLAIALTVLSLNYLGEWVRDRLDPRLAKK